jgi:hypothetical protein
MRGLSPIFGLRIGPPAPHRVPSRASRAAIAAIPSWPTAFVAAYSRADDTSRFALCWLTGHNARYSFTGSRQFSLGQRERGGGCGGVIRSDYSAVEPHSLASAWMGPTGRSIMRIMLPKRRNDHDDPHDHNRSSIMLLTVLTISTVSSRMMIPPVMMSLRPPRQVAWMDR